MTDPMLRIALSFLVSLAAGCTTVELDEEVLFQAKPTILPSDFPTLGYTLRPLTLPTDGASLDGWYLDRPNERATVLYFGGQGFHLVHSSPMLKFFSARNVDVVVFDYRGYGKSTGEPSVAVLKEDGSSIYRLATETLPIPPTKLVVHGHSMGSFLATSVATRHEVAAVVLESPATDAEHWKETVIPGWLRLLIDFQIPDGLANESNLERVQQVEMPILLAVGTDDPITPPELARKLHAAAPSSSKQLVEIEGAGHNDVTVHESFAIAFDQLLDAVPSQFDR